MILSTRIQELLGSMTLEQKVGQLFVFTFVSEAQALQDLKLFPGGFIRLFSDVFTVTRQTRLLQSESSIPLLICADFERGVHPMVSGGTDFCSMMTLGATGSDELAGSLGAAIAREAAAVGVNLNYVPVMDVNVNEDNPIINIRSLGGDPQLVSQLGQAFIRGHREAGVLTCAKHFPGHGDTAIDSHTSLSSIPVSRERLETIELAPFRAAIRAGVDCIMSAHLLIPCIEPEKLPATLSHRILTGLLRHEMGFEGVVTSDALEMGAISRYYTVEDATIRALNAGCDMLIMPTDNRYSVKILLGAVRDGRIPEKRLDEAVGRILSMKESGNILDAPLPDPRTLLDKVYTAEHRQLALELGHRGTTLVHNRGAVLPIPPGSRVVVISLSNFEDGRTYFLEPRCLGSYIDAVHEGSVTSVHCGQLNEAQPHEFGAAERALCVANEAEIIVIAVFMKVVVNRGSVSLDLPVFDFLNRVRALSKPTVLVSLGSPYLVKQVHWPGAFVCTYSPSTACQEAVANLLVGKMPFQGRLPVALHEWGAESP
jgi:beta-N-acetylhexosaminidase